jgi:hypothetical protein
MGGADAVHDFAHGRTHATAFPTPSTRLSSLQQDLDRHEPLAFVAPLERLERVLGGLLNTARPLESNLSDRNVRRASGSWHHATDIADRGNDMRVAALYDIHGNMLALEATLREVRDARVDLVVVGGDVLPGPMPRETLACLMALEIPVRFIHGNGERIVATYLAGGDISEVPQAHREVIEWTAQQLAADERQAIAHWPFTSTPQCLRIIRIRGRAAAANSPR